MNFVRPMNPKVLARHLSLPAGIHKDTGAILSLNECRGNPTYAVASLDMTTEQKIAMVKARWLAGEWGDLVYGADGLIDRERAIRELETQTEIGRRLMAI